jgi:hypothetical protein
MKVRLAVSMGAAPAKEAELAQAFRQGCADGIWLRAFRGISRLLIPDKTALLELWSDQSTLDTHAKSNITRARLPPELRVEAGWSKDYQYSRTN